MPFSGGYNLSRMGTYYAQRAEDRPQVEPIPDGVNPLDVLDPETRALVTTIDDPTELEPEADLGERLGSALLGACVGAVIGGALVNGGSRYRPYRSGPMDVGMTASMAAIGATIGAVAGFAHAGDPPRRPVMPVTSNPQHGASLGSASSAPAAFSPLPVG
jgi:hypothetical protein